MHITLNAKLRSFSAGLVGLLTIGLLGNISPTYAENRPVIGFANNTNQFNSANLSGIAYHGDSTPNSLASVFSLSDAGRATPAEPAVISPDITPGPDGFAEVIIRFSDPGVAPAAQGDPYKAVASLQVEAEQRWDDVVQKIAPLEQAGRVEVITNFWVTGALLVRAQVDAQTLAALAQLPGAREVIPNFTVNALDMGQIHPAGPSSLSADVRGPDGQMVTWGVDRIGAAQVWHDFGVRGEGVRVAVLDTGVDASHPDLADKLVGANLNDPTYPGGWISFDGQGKAIPSRPSDPGTHGTHVAGTILGGDASGTQIGVAPGAQLMSANVLSGAGSGSYAAILAGLQWALAPHTANSVDERVGAPANVINMSLGVGEYSTAFADIIRNIRDAGIFPAIAIGNNPCGVAGASSPAILYEAVAVGMTTPTDQVNRDSCGTIATWPADVTARYGWPDSFVKPNVSAPGTDTYSSVPGGGWGRLSGSSMATPHVAGAAALMMSARAGMSVDEIQSIMEATAWHPNKAAAPDTGYGHGRIDVHRAISQITVSSGISGTVTDSKTGNPIPGVEVSYAEVGERWTTDQYGQFQAPLVPGTYVLHLRAVGYEDVDIEVMVRERTIVIQPVSMTQLTTGKLTGQVIDRASGQPLVNATVVVVGYPWKTTTDAKGKYHFDTVPTGSYQVRADYPDYISALSGSAAVEPGKTTGVNFALGPQMKALVLGDSGRTVKQLAKYGITADATRALPSIAELKTGGYDVVIFDVPATLDAQTIANYRAYAEKSGIGTVWLDLGNTDASGIAQLATLTGNPAERNAANDPALQQIAYQVSATHPIFTREFAAGTGYGVGDLIVQNNQEPNTGTKYHAWFTSAAGAQVIAKVATVAADGTTSVLGDGIATIETSARREILLSLFGTAASMDSRFWTMGAEQVFINAISWVAPERVSSATPEIIPPTAPPAPPAPGDSGKPGDTPAPPGGSTPAPGPGPAPWQPPDNERPTPAPPAHSGGQGNPGVGRRPAGFAPAGHAPAANAVPEATFTPRPKITPADPVKDISYLTGVNQRGIKGEITGDILAVTIPDTQPGDWFYVHLYPGAHQVDWVPIRADGTLGLNVSKLADGQYSLTFISDEGKFVGWLPLNIGDVVPAPDKDSPADSDNNSADGAAPSADPNAPGDDGANAEQRASASGGTSLFGMRDLSPLELTLIGLSGLMLLAAAFIILLGGRRSGGTKNG